MKERNSQTNIIAKGIKVNNLKNISVSIPQNSFTVITGVSGSGKSSLAFDTLFAEGQRRYIESLSSYARQFIGRMQKPEVEKIEGIPPAIAVHQRKINRNPRSTVGTMTEIYEYLKLFFAKIGRTYSPKSGQEVTRFSVANVVDIVMRKYANEKVYILSPIMIQKGETFLDRLNILLQLGYSRVFMDGDIAHIEDVLKDKALQNKYKSGYILVDRLIAKDGEESTNLRLSSSIHTAFNESGGYCALWAKEEFRIYSNRFELDGIEFVKPSENFFSFNNKYGACPTCQGLGTIEGISEDLVITKPYLSVYDNVVNCWKGVMTSNFKDMFIKQNARRFPIHRPYNELTPQQKDMLWNGDKKTYYGINDFFAWLKKENYKIQNRVLISRYSGKTTCPDCHGSRLRHDASYVKVCGKSIIDILQMPIDELVEYFDNLTLTEHEQQAVERILKEIRTRLSYLMKVGLGYLTLNRSASTLSGGEAQRILLSTSLGSPLVGSMYILDEPTIGLHPVDTRNLIGVLKDLRDQGNTVIVVEHDMDVISSADYVIDIGPMAGVNGGQVVFNGTQEQLRECKTSLTAQYLRGEKKIPLAKPRPNNREFLLVDNIFENNLQNVCLKIPLNQKVVVCGVSGSGKSTLINKVFVNALRMKLDIANDYTPKCSQLYGSVDLISDVQVVDQSSITRSSRSNAALYTGIFDDIRTLYSSLPLAKARGYKPGFFSFNVEGGRCEACKGEGTVEIQMQFMADVTLECDHCHGKRYKAEVLEVKYKDKTISDVLNMTVDEAFDFFYDEKDHLLGKISRRLSIMKYVGLGYLKLGQSLSTLSGGEAQRIKIVTYLDKGSFAQKTLFVFDEPTTGLHVDDINKLNACFDALLDMGHSVVIIEHHLDIIKTADWVIEMGPGGGKHGGQIIFEGDLTQLIIGKKNPTSEFIKAII